MFIRNSKVAPFPVASGECRGVTVLFNHPGGHSVKIAPTVQRLHCQVWEDPQLRLYRTAFTTWETITAHPEVRALAPASIAGEAMHVTACDLFHPGNIDDISDASFRSELNDLLRGLPYSVARGWPSPISSVSTLLGERQMVVRFEFDHLRFFGDALVALLRPSDAESEANFTHVVECRKAIDQILKPFGKEESGAFHPHVTLSYFPNPDCTMEAKALLPTWHEPFRDALKGHTIECLGADVFAFDTMLNFYSMRRGPASLLIGQKALGTDKGLAQRGDRKVCVTTLSRSEEFSTSDVWTAATPADKCAVEIAAGMELAFFTEEALQDLHYHQYASEIYTVLRGGPMQIIVEGREFALEVGESILIHPRAAHQVIRNGTQFLAQVVAINSHGVLDKFVIPQAPRVLAQFYSGQVPPLVPNVTLVAFRHTPKPPGLQSLISEVLDRLRLRLGSAFKQYGLSWMHSTWIGLECARRNYGLFNVNLASNYGRVHKPDFESFAREVQRLTFPVRLRYGGFSMCSCTAEEKQQWQCAKGSEFHSCGRSAYEGTLFAFPGTPVVLTGWPIGPGDSFPRTAFHFRRTVEEMHIADKHHFDRQERRDPRWYWENDDCGITLGRIEPDASSQLVADIVAELRHFLAAARTPVYAEITGDDLAVVKYNDTKLETCSQIVPLKDLTAEILEHLYDDVGW